MKTSRLDQKKKKAVAVLRDKKFRRHSGRALCCAGKAARRARSVSNKSSWKSEVGVAVAGGLVLISLAAWVWKSLSNQSQP